MTSVLIVDDHPSFRSWARRLLELSGFAVVGEAGDGKSALSAVSDLRPDIVLLDVRLPDIDGFEVADRLAVLDSPPTVVLTSTADAADYRHRLTGAPVAGFVSKERLSAAAFSAVART